MQQLNSSHLRELCDVFTKIRSRPEALVLLKDMLTPRELASVAERWQIIKRLARGMPQRDVSRSLKVSIDKVTRGAKALKFSRGGFRLFLWRRK